MKWRKMSEEEVEDTILNPENVKDSIKSRKNAFKHIDKKWLKVTFTQESDLIIIITVIDKNN